MGDVAGTGSTLVEVMQFYPEAVWLEIHRGSPREQKQNCRPKAHEGFLPPVGASL